MIYQSKTVWVQSPIASLKLIFAFNKLQCASSVLLLQLFKKAYVFQGLYPPLNGVWYTHRLSNRCLNFKLVLFPGKSFFFLYSFLSMKNKTKGRKQLTSTLINKSMGPDSKVKEPMEEPGNSVSHELSRFWVRRLCKKFGYPNSETDL